MRFFFILLFSLTTTSGCVSASKTSNTEAMISESKALEIAEKQLVQTYGERVLRQRPFQTKLVGDVWQIRGQLPCPKEPNLICHGGVAYIEISAKDGTVIHMIHGK